MDTTKFVTSFVLALALLGCGKKDADPKASKPDTTTESPKPAPKDEIPAKGPAAMEKARDVACACKDAACAEKSNQALEAAKLELSELNKLSEADFNRIGDARTAGEKCTKKILSPEAE